MYTAIAHLRTDEVRTYRCETRAQLRLWMALLPMLWDIHVQHAETVLGAAETQQRWEEACWLMDEPGCPRCRVHTVACSTYPASPQAAAHISPGWTVRRAARL